MEFIGAFNAAGNKRFQELLDERPSDLIEQVQSLLTSPEYTFRIKASSKLPKRPQTRFELGKALYEEFGDTLRLPEGIDPTSLWNWLGAAYLFHIIGPTKDFDQIKNSARWLLSPNPRRLYRHLIAGPYWAYRAHSDNPEQAMCILCQEVLTPGELVEQIQSTPDIAYSVCAGVATALYYDPVKKKIKTGAGNKTGPGIARRLTANYLNQIRVNVDIRGMTVQELLDMLPKEYDTFKKL
jgi:hypothetical protein